MTSHVACFIVFCNSERKIIFYDFNINMLSLLEKYKKEIMPVMKKKFHYLNDLAVPKVKKVVINVGTGKNRENQKLLEEIEKSLILIAGQKPVKTLSKKSIAAFKTRKGMQLGMKITLRRYKMYSFLERLINLALPRTRDFRGLSVNAIDNFGNLTIGIKEHIVFPEISHENVHSIFGFGITVVTSAKSKEEGLELFKLMGFPIK